MDIKIDIDDDRYFTDVAPVVDRDEFAKEIERLRSALKVKMPLSKNDYSKVVSEKEAKLIDKEIEKSRKRLFLPVIFRSVISAVVFRNEITNDDYSPAYLVHKTGDFYDKHGESSPDETYGIILSPGARDEDVLKAYRDYRDILGNVSNVNSENSELNYKFTNLVWDINKKKPSIKKYREWYKAIKADASYAEIAEKETLNCPMPEGHQTGKKKPKGCTCYDESTIRKGFETYEALLRKTPTF